MSSRPSFDAVQRQVDRWSLIVFMVVVVVALPLLLHLGRDQWFFLDEWWILSDGSESRGLLDAHNGHWITVPIVVYRLTYQVWGLHTYVPYQVPVVLLHLATVVLLRVVMRRLGVRSWIATLVALGFVFFGSGGDNIVFGFQISLTGSLFFGLVLLLLADNDGPIERRDWIALAVGAFGLMTSGIFVAMVVGVGAAVLLRRGVRIAAFYTVPFGVVYGAWYLRYGRGSTTQSLSSPGDMVTFCTTMLRGTFTALAGGGWGGVALGLVALGAIVVAVVGAIRTREPASLALVAGLVVAWVVFAGLTAAARSGFLATAGDAGRYLHVTAALVLPLIGLGSEYLAQRVLVLGVLPIAMLALGVPGNVDEFSDRWSVLGDRDAIITLAHSDSIGDVPPDLEPLRTVIVGLPITSGWLAREADAGRIPDPGRVDPITELTNLGLLALHQEETSGEQRCPQVEDVFVETGLAVGDRISFEGEIRVAIVDGSVRSRPISFTSSEGSSIVAELAVDVSIQNPRGARPRLCEE